jgi:hypothetical protein
MNSFHFSTITPWFTAAYHSSLQTYFVKRRDVDVASEMPFWEHPVLEVKANPKEIQFLVLLLLLLLLLLLHHDHVVSLPQSLSRLSAVASTVSLLLVVL